MPVFDNESAFESFLTTWIGSHAGAAGGTVVQTIPQAAQPAINTDVATLVGISGLAQAITSMSANLSGTPTRGQELWIEIQDNGTPRAINWGASFSGLNYPLPTTTVPGVVLSTLFKFNVITSTWECLLVTGGLPRDAVDKSLALVAPFSPSQITTAVAPGSANMHGTRVVIPKSGTLRDLTLWCGNAGSGHLLIAVYDTGQASAGTRTRLAASGILNNPAVANSWFPVYDPALAVVEGQQLDIVYQSDSTTDTYGRGTAGANIAQNVLPANYLKPGNYASADPTVGPYLTWFVANTFGNGLPATIPDTGLLGDGTNFVMGRIS